MNTILEGSVRKAGNRIRITAQLITAADGSHLWSERYDREMTDVFAIQDEISQAIAEKLRVQLSGDPPSWSNATRKTSKPITCTSRDAIISTGQRLKALRRRKSITNRRSL